MKCPHCITEIHPTFQTDQIDIDKHGTWACVHQVCPSCKQLIVEIVRGTLMGIGPGFNLVNVKERLLALPRGSNRPSPSQEVPQEFSEDYIEAARFLSD